MRHNTTISRNKYMFYGKCLLHQTKLARNLPPRVRVLEVMFLSPYISDITSNHIHHNTSHHITCHIIYHIISYHIISYHIMSCHVVMSCHVMSCHIMSCHAMPYHTIPYHITPYHTTRQARGSILVRASGDPISMVMNTLSGHALM